MSDRALSPAQAGTVIASGQRGPIAKIDLGRRVQTVRRRIISCRAASLKMWFTGRTQIARENAAARHYENRVSPLYWAVNGEKQIRVLVQLVRDRPTSFDADFGAPVATVRHEIWQYTRSYSSWTKDRKTEVLDRTLLLREEFQRWTWIWEPRLGGIEVNRKPVTIVYRLPTKFDPRSSRGWFPNR